jgi:hypothetical protein
VFRPRFGAPPALRRGFIIMNAKTFVRGT